MKTYFIALALLPCMVLAQQHSADFNDLYSNITYALAHSKKALEVTGFDHQVYYAERALTMVDKSQALINSCGCLGVEEKSFQIKKHLSKAVDPMDWYEGRFYSKKAIAAIDELITTLDECSTETLVTTESVEYNSAITKESGTDLEANHLEYNAYIEEINNSIAKLLRQLDNDFNSTAEEDAIQRKFYTERTKQMLQSAILQIEEEVNE